MALDWLPILPTGVVRRIARGRGTESLLTPIVPIPRPDPPTEMTWQPIFPVRTFVRPRVFSATGSVFPLFPAIQPTLLSWLPVSHATPIRRLVRPPVIPPPFEISALLSVPSRLAWMPILSTRMVRRQPRPGGSWWLVDPLTLLNAAPCIEWASETATSPRLTAESLVSPAFSTETCISPSFTAEDLC